MESLNSSLNLQRFLESNYSLIKWKKIWLDFLADNVYKIREQSMQNLVDLKKILGDDWFTTIWKLKNKRVC